MLCHPFYHYPEQICSYETEKVQASKGKNKPY